MYDIIRITPDKKKFTPKHCYSKNCIQWTKSSNVMIVTKSTFARKWTYAWPWIVVKITYSDVDPIFWVTSPFQVYQY